MGKLVVCRLGQAIAKRRSRVLLGLAPVAASAPDKNSAIVSFENLPDTTVFLDPVVDFQARLPFREGGLPLFALIVCGSSREPEARSATGGQRPSVRGELGGRARPDLRRIQLRFRGAALPILEVEVHGAPEPAWRPGAHAAHLGKPPARGLIIRRRPEREQFSHQIARFYAPQPGLALGTLWVGGLGWKPESIAAKASELNKSRSPKVRTREALHFVSHFVGILPLYLHPIQPIISLCHGSQQTAGLSCCDLDHPRALLDSDAL
eukprot:CAMPEP_0172602242 /NCGR_PEP_ID=MMETSP1068-20121228/22421_1 /TAXON_ID=35684 /ORGANISM="Pseudopedinella elastica, Strain CCMP716" /LENGTH=264 /DNA_ID=CAMNT_0013403531 /DNA_START=168 /DNA_END=962 /DNA_ORIENTATION=-